MRRINARSKDSEGNDSRLASRIVLGIEPEALIRRLGSCAGRTVSLSLYYKAADSVALSECCEGRVIGVYVDQSQCLLPP